MMKILVDCMEGIGDNLYARPFINKLSRHNDVYMATTLPDLYTDLNVKFIRTESKLRTQSQQLVQTSVTFETDIPNFDRKYNFRYEARDVAGGTIAAAVEKKLGFERPMNPQQYRSFLYMPKTLPKHYINIPLTNVAVIRPVTIRKEFECTARAPNPDYVDWCARVLKNAGYFVISIADCEEGEEWMEGQPPADLHLHKGELGITGMLSLIKDADIVVGGSGFIIPAAMTANVPLFTIFGGRGQYDAPQRVFDPRMNMRNIGWALPDNFCRCTKMEHDCDKTITNLDDKFYEFLSRIDRR